MFQSSPAFAFPARPQPLVLLAAREIAALLDGGEQVTRSCLNAVLGRVFGGSDAQGRWRVADAHAALELAQVLWLRRIDELTPTVSAEIAERHFGRLDALLPAQTVRSEEQLELQQFATPPRIAWLAARAAAISAKEILLEPSAGTGMLAHWGARSAVRLALNEISPLRRECLASLFPEALLTGHDGELIDELLEPALVPSLVMMNPPYSHGLERGHDGQTGARHLRATWKRLAAGGRLVAIMPEWFDTRRFLASLSGPVSLRLNAEIERGFVRHGTSITTRLLVLEKVASAAELVLARTNDFAELSALIDALPPRAEAQVAAPNLAPAKPPALRLVSRR